MGWARVSIGVTSKQSPGISGRSGFTGSTSAVHNAAMAVSTDAIPAVAREGELFDMRDVAFYLVENDKGEVLFVQRAYGKEKASGRCPVAWLTAARAADMLPTGRPGRRRVSS